MYERPCRVKLGFRGLRFPSLSEGGRPTGDGLNAVFGWVSQIKDLLECHNVVHYHHPEEFFLIKIFGDMDGKRMCIRFRTFTEGEVKCESLYRI